jgi:Flp pilus assembly pilin Flp
MGIRMSLCHSSRLAQPRRDQAGQGMVEYGLVLGLIALVVLGLLQLVGKSTNTALCTVSQAVARDWCQQSPATNPGSRYGYAIAYDAATKTDILFGGQNGTELGDTWSWNGSTWTQLGGTNPPARSLTSMAYDAATTSIVLWGGYNGSGGLADTWVWNGTWSQLGAAGGPAASWNEALAYDAATGAVIMSGTAAGNSTWSFNGATWSQLSPATSPPYRGDAGMTYNATTKTVDLFGGTPDGSTLYNDTWQWNGTTWTQMVSPTCTIACPNSPSARFFHTMGYDDGTGTDIMFGGHDSSSGLNDTWAWSGTSWTQVNPPFAPPSRWAQATSMPRGTVAGTLLAYGGITAGSGTDTWQFG